MTLDEKTMEHLEQQIPELADSAFKQAYWQALASGASVLELDDGIIYEVSPDGTRKEVKRVGPRLKVAPGETRRLP